MVKPTAEIQRDRKGFSVAKYSLGEYQIYYIESVRPGIEGDGKRLNLCGQW